MQFQALSEIIPDSPAGTRTDLSNVAIQSSIRGPKNAIDLMEDIDLYNFVIRDLIPGPGTATDPVEGHPTAYSRM